MLHWNGKRSFSSFPTFKDHNNREDFGYKLCGQDFVLDLIGILDLLWPLIVLMLQSQANWCPGWKLCCYVRLVKAKRKKFIRELRKDVPDAAICPRLHKRISEIKQLRYGNSELVLGWFVTVEGEDGKKLLASFNSILKIAVRN